MKIQSRLLLVSISLTLVAVSVSLLVSIYLTRNALESQAFDKLAAVHEARRLSLARYLDTIHRQMIILSEAPTTIKLLHSLTDSYAKLTKSGQMSLQQNAEMAHLKAGDSGGSWVMSGGDYSHDLDVANSFLMNRQKTYGWEDMFLIDVQGNVVFSMNKDKDFATNLLTGPWKDSGLARAATPLLHDAVPGVLSFSDFSHYAPIANLPAAFVALPVFDVQGFVGVVAIQLPGKQLNALMTDVTGMGKTGETFLLGKDAWMLSDARFHEGSAILSMQNKSQVAARVLGGGNGQDELVDYRGQDTYVSFSEFKPFQDEAVLGDPVTWGVVTKVDRDEVLADYYRLRLVLILTGVVLGVLAMLAGLWGARSITRPLFGIRDALVRLARGEVVDVPSLARRDEIGDMAKAAEAFRKMTAKVEQDHWVTENVSVLTSIVSAQTELGAAADSVLHLLCERLDVPVGAIYLAVGAGQYQRVGSHGLARRSQTEDVFLRGEGLVGQCAKDNQAVVVSPVPTGLSIISSGLAEFPPHELVCYPVAHKNEVLLVLELAATRSLSVMQHEFLKHATAELGLHFANLQVAASNLALLAETRTQAETLREQQDGLLKQNEEMKAMTEELRSQSEEMKAQNEELKANQEELRAQQEEMKHKNLLLETQSTELKQVLSEVKSKAEELERTNRYKSEFLANMSHELRTPLNSVLILSKDLAENEGENLTPDQVESAAVIGESGTQLLTLINDILDLSKIEAGKLELLKETFPLDELLVYLRRVFMPQADKKQIAFSLQVAPDVPETITTDRQRLTQILTNLLSNAIKFTEHGEVTVMVSRHHDGVQFAVSDSGIGIPADKLEHIFGAFQQVDGTTSRKYGGSGLGLAISRHLSTLLGGDIVVQSEQGHGSCFTVRLNEVVAVPTSMPSLPQVQPVSPLQVPAPSALVSAGGNILVVEDDTRLLTILARMISAQGFTPVCVESAEQAWTAITQAVPIGILLDIGLPQMNGMELLRRMKDDRVAARIPVYIMSGAADSGEAKALGARGFIKKPVTRDTIATAIKGMLQVRQAVPTKRVLLVDNNSEDVAAIQTLFAQDALEIVPVATGSSALQLLRTQRFDTVILDLELSDVQGLTWLKQATELVNPPPVVVYSARELREDEVFELKAVAESIVNKAALNNRLREEVLLAVHQEDSKTSLPMPAKAVSAGKKLLLVDDDARNLFALGKALRAKGFVTEVAADSSKALEMLNQTNFDAVLTDIMMPDMDGYALIRQIRALGYDDLPVFAITAKAMRGDDALCIEAGATAYLAKPVDMDKLLALLHKA